eukprot:3627422-Pleurochrysis_carterae.AAC.1
MVVKISEYAMSREKQLRRRVPHRAAQHTYRESDVRPVGWRRRIGFGRQRVVDELGKVIGGGGVSFVHGCRDAVRQECIDHVRNVTGL